MSHCPHCGYRLSVHSPPPSVCGRCGKDLAGAERPEPQVAVAKLRNLAEVGYFADFLESRDIRTDIHQHNEFSALDGSWDTLFILRVCQSQAKKASQLITEELQQTDVEEDWMPRSDSPPRSSSAASVLAPVALVLMAGGLFYYSARPVPPDQRATGRSFWRALDEDRKVFESTDGEKPTLRLRFDRHSRRVFLEEDIDGDGRYDGLRDRVRSFAAEELAR